MTVVSGWAELMIGTQKTKPNKQKKPISDPEKTKSCAREKLQIYYLSMYEQYLHSDSSINTEYKYDQKLQHNAIGRPGKVTCTCPRE